MDLRNTGKRPAAIIRAAIVVFALGFISCAAEDPDIGTQDIAMRWITIERSLARARLAPAAATADDDHCAIIQALGEFHELALSFVDSLAYRTYRAVAPSPGLGAAAAHAVPEIHRLADLTLSLRQAALDGDWDAAALVSSDISGAILHTTAWGRAANQAAASMYSWLLFALAVFIALAVFAMRFFHWLMTRAQKREAEGSAFSQAVLWAQEEERTRISLELHDTVVQEMRRLSGDIDEIAKADEEKRREELYAQASARQAAITGGLRDICNNLAPPDIGPRGLPDALRRLCVDFAERTGIDCRMETPGDVPTGFSDKERNLQIFRIVQEALTNIEKHAKATEAIVEPRRADDGNLVITVFDNGAGPNPADGDARRGMGIRGMKERAALLCGDLAVGKNERGEGTQVRLRVPASSANADADALLIDDHPLTNKGIADGLKETGLFPALAQAGSLGEARRRVEEVGKLPSLIVLDIQLGRENGLDFIPFLQEHCRAKDVPMPPVLVCSAHDDPFRIEAAIKMGAAGYLTKGGNARELSDAVEAVMRGEVYVPAEHAAGLEGISDKYRQLSAREFEIVAMVRQGKTSQQIAADLGLSRRTVEAHLNNIYNKTGAAKRSELQEL